MVRRGLAFYGGLLVTVLVCTLLIVPIALSMISGIMTNYSAGASAGFTLHWVAVVWDQYSATILASLMLAAACLLVTMVAGIPAAYVLAKRQNFWTRAIEEILIFPLAVPGIAIALGIILTYGNYSQFRRSWAIILVGHVVYTLPFMVRAVLAVLSSIDLRALEEGASSLGASFTQRFFQIVLPNSRSGIVAGALMVVTLSVGEFNITMLLQTPFTRTLPIGLADAYASSRLEICGAYTLIFFALIIPLLLGIQATQPSAALLGSAQRNKAGEQT
jgi:putative spermidine/putrescine transport system permease protein